MKRKADVRAGRALRNSSCIVLSLSIFCCQSGSGDATGEAGSSGNGGTASVGSGGRAGAGTGGRGGSSSGSGGSAPMGNGGTASDGAAGLGPETGSSDSSAAGASGAGGGTDAGGTAGGDAAGILRDGGPLSDVGLDSGNADSDGGLSPYSPCPPAGQTCRILPLGDSITDGFNVPGGFRIELFRSAHAAGKTITFVGAGINGPLMVDGVAFPRNHEGHNGFTIDNEPAFGRTGISGTLTDMAMANFRPHIVTLMIGTNDVDVNIDLATADSRLGAVMDQILTANPNVLLVVAQITPTGTDATNLRVQAYNARIPALVQARVDAGRHVLLVDMNSAFISDPNYKTSLLADNLHPTVAGYTLLGQIWYRALENRLP